MKYIALTVILALCLTGCKGMLDEGYAFPPGTNFTPTEETVPAPDGPLPREEEVEEQIDLKTQEFIANEETLPIDWRSKNRITLLVNDHEKAARLVLLERQTVELPMSTPITIQLGGVNGEKASVIIDGTAYIMGADDEENNEAGDVLIHILDVVEV